MRVINSVVSIQVDNVVTIGNILFGITENGQAFFKSLKIAWENKNKHLLFLQWSRFTKGGAPVPEVPIVLTNKFFRLGSSIGGQFDLS